MLNVRDSARISPGATIASARRAIARLLREHAFDTPELDARLLLSHALGFDHAQLVANSGRCLSATDAEKLNAFLSRRLAHEPVARIVGKKEFWGLPIGLSPATLVPRPDTETVVEAALATIGDRAAPLRIADLGTGSGALLLAMLSELPRAYGVGTDLSLPALVCARNNAARLNLAERASFVAGDFGAPLSGPFHCIVSNPPYLREQDIPYLAREVRDYDPRGALDGGPDGHAAYRTLARQAGSLLDASGALIVEIGAGQEEAVAAIMVDQALVAESTAWRDLAGIPRALVLRPSACRQRITG
jgi:release factor glutamine methyltransferase